MNRLRIPFLTGHVPVASTSRLLLLALLLPVFICTLYLYHTYYYSSPLTITFAISPEPILNTTWHTLIHAEEHAARKPYAFITESAETPNRKKVALLIENRVIPYIVPLLLHFLSVIPPDWSFRFMGSPAAQSSLLTSPAIRRAIDAKKLVLGSIPEQHNVDTRSSLNNLFVDPWFYETWLYPAEWLFVFQTDSMVCSQSNMTLNDFVAEGYPYLGASKSTTIDPNPDLNGGISLRHVPSLLSLLRTLARPIGEFSEDWYFSTHLSMVNNTRVVTGKAALRFAVEMVWDDEGGMPFAFHPYAINSLFRGPVGPHQGHWRENMDRAHLYCPELALITMSRFQCDCTFSLPQLIKHLSPTSAAMFAVANITGEGDVQLKAQEQNDVDKT